jgi:hypothetical protein
MNVERRHPGGGEPGPENEPNPEIAELFRQLDDEAEQLGVRLEDADFVAIGPDETMRLHGKVELILGALAVVAGTSVFYETTQSLLQSGPEQLDAIRLMTRLGLAASAGGGAVLMFKGLARLEVGYRRLRGL